MSIQLTQSAADRVRTYLSSEGHGEGLRFGVKASGCSGYSYVIGLAECVDSDDRVFESHGVKVIVDSKSLPIVDGTRIDFRKDGLNEAFHFENPKATDSCGCGESFTV